MTLLGNNKSVVGCFFWPILWIWTHMNELYCLKLDFEDLWFLLHCNSHRILKSLPNVFVVKLEVKIWMFWNPMRTQIQNPSVSSLAVVLGTEVCQFNPGDRWGFTLYKLWPWPSNICLKWCQVHLNHFLRTVKASLADPFFTRWRNLCLSRFASTQTLKSRGGLSDYPVFLEELDEAASC